MTASTHIYKTAIAKNKQNNFLSLLRKLGIQKDDLTLTHSRGDFYLYEIDLSKRNDDSISFLRRELNESQVNFL